MISIRTLLSRNHTGITLVELVMAMAVTAIIMSGTTAVIYQVFMSNARNTAHMTAVKQVENALHFMVRDIQMAQTIETDDLSGDEILKLAWVDWDNIEYEVTYSWVDGELIREYSDGSRTSVCRYIASLAVSPKPYVNGKVVVDIRAQVGAGTIGESRIVEILPRSG